MRGRLLAAAGMAALLVGASGARADTLRDALVRTYENNPTLTGQRAQVRVLDENVEIARGGGRPQLSATSGLNQGVVSSGQGGLGRNFNVGGELALPIFTGGRVSNSIRAADERVLAGRATLQAVEGDIFTEAVGAYMDVIRDRSIVTLNENQVRVLETNLQASRDRFEVGDLTRTDVAQSEARLEQARSNLALVRGRLTNSDENYRRVIGTLPDELQPPPPLPPLPQTADQTVDIALANNQDLVSIAAQIRAAERDVRVVRADRLPQLSAVTSGSYVNNLGRADEAAGVPNGTLDNSVTSLGVGLSARIPIYQGGIIGARVRQAQAVQSQLIEQGVQIERATIAQARAAFASYQASLDSIASNEIAVAANSLALEGTRAEQTVGTRNVLDVLNAEQELLNSQVLLVTARRDAYVAGFGLLNAMGQAEAQDLNLDGGALYDASVNYKRVVGRDHDWDTDDKPVPVATRTVAQASPVSSIAEGEFRVLPSPPPSAETVPVLDPVNSPTKPGMVSPDEPGAGSNTPPAAPRSGNQAPPPPMAQPSPGSTNTTTPNSTVTEPNQ